MKKSPFFLRMGTLLAILLFAGCGSPSSDVKIPAVKVNSAAQPTQTAPVSLTVFVVFGNPGSNSGGADTSMNVLCSGTGICAASSAIDSPAIPVTFQLNMNSQPITLIISFSIKALAQFQPAQVPHFQQPNISYPFQSNYPLAKLLGTALGIGNLIITPQTPSKLQLGPDGDTMNDTLTFQ